MGKRSKRDSGIEAKLAMLAMVLEQLSDRTEEHAIFIRNLNTAMAFVSRRNRDLADRVAALEAKKN